jgi:Double zinc ribbon
MSAAVTAGFFQSETWLVTRNLGFLFLVVFWLAVGYWTYKDARRRIQDPWLVAMATLLGLIPPFVGAIIYMLFRPPEYLDEVRERELEMKALQAMRPEDERCPVCRSPVEAGYLVCPVCTSRLRDACTGCKAPLDPLWQVCPFCETPVVRPVAVDLADTVAPPLDERVAPSAATERSKARRARRQAK